MRRKQGDIQREEIVTAARTEAERLKKLLSLKSNSKKKKQLQLFANKLLPYLF